MASLRAELPYNLAFDSLVEVRISSTNIIGTQISSSFNTEGAKIRTEPNKALNPLKGSQTNQSQVEVIIQETTQGIESGNSAILAYELVWNNGSGLTDIIVSENLESSRILSGLIQGTDYVFKTRARNIYGYGEFSDEVTIRAASVPDVMLQVSTFEVGTDILVSWPETPDGGYQISAYKIELFVTQTATFAEQISVCDGSLEAVRSARQCTIPQSYLTDTLSMQVGEIVQLRVQARNQIGWGGFSQVNTAGAIVQSVPQ